MLAAARLPGCLHVALLKLLNLMASDIFPFTALVSLEDAGAPETPGHVRDPSRYV